MEPLLPRVAAGDPLAVRACLDRYGGLVWALARRLLGAGADAEDAVQEIFVELWRTAGRFDSRLATEATFVTLVARRRLIDRRRRQHRRPEPRPLPDTLTANDASLHAVDLHDEARLATSALNGLREEQRRALSLVVCQGLTHEEAAQATGLPLGTIKTHVRRGLIRLREELSAVKSPKGGVS